MTLKTVYEINPLTRVEGQGKISLILDKEEKHVENVRFHVQNSRFYEKLCEGRNAEYIPQITNSLCENNFAATKAIEAAWRIKIPETAYKLRQLFMHANQYHSHLRHFWIFSSPDLLYGFNSRIQNRNINKIFKDYPEKTNMIFKMMDFGQKIGKAIGGKFFGSVSTIPGGMKNKFSSSLRDGFLAQISDQLEHLQIFVKFAKDLLNKNFENFQKFKVNPVFFISMAKKVNDKYIHDLYEGNLVFLSLKGQKIEYNPEDYQKVIGERSLPHSYATHTYYKPMGYPKGIMSANSLARINICDEMGTPWAEQERINMVKKWKNDETSVIYNPFAFHWARIVETVSAFENITMLLKDSSILSSDIKTKDIKPQKGRGIGMVEAPDGNQIYDIFTDKEGICKKLNILTGTNHNVAAIENNLLEVSNQIFENQSNETMTQQLNL